MAQFPPGGVPGGFAPGVRPVATPLPMRMGPPAGPQGYPGGFPDRPLGPGPFPPHGMPPQAMPPFGMMAPGMPPFGAPQGVNLLQRESACAGSPVVAQQPSLERASTSGAGEELTRRDRRAQTYSGGGGNGEATGHPAADAGRKRDVTPTRTRDVAPPGRANTTGHDAQSPATRRDVTPTRTRDVAPTGRANTTGHDAQPPCGEREKSGRLGLSSKGRHELQELMQSKDKLRQLAEKPFRRAQTRHLNFAAFRAALVEMCKDIGMKVPDEKQTAKMFEKHRREEGLGQEEFESLVFRMLTFLLASGEVSSVAPSAPAQGEERDKRWREEFLQQNKKRFQEVYELGKKLGEGSFGAAYVATHRTDMSGPNRRIRVCKIIKKDLADEVGTSHQRVREEFAVLKKLDHPNVVRIFEDFEDERSFYLLMEQCKGGDLQDAVKSPATRDAMQWEHWAAKVIYQTLSGIAYCHGKGVIHKDLKPENVMMSSREFQDVHVVIVDFGLAEMFSNTRRCKEIAGTPPFMAPEVWTGSFTKKCDIWGVGCILFYILSGALPFMARKVEDFPKVVTKDPNWQVIGGASAEAQHAVWRMLCKAEAGRPSASEMCNDRWFMVHGLGSERGAAPAIAEKHLKGLMQVKKRNNFEKFVSRLVATQLDAGQQKRVNEAFNAFDKDKDGTLSRDELRRGLLMLGAGPAEAEQVANELDVSKTGRISYTEFLAGVMDLRGRSPKERDKLLWLAWQQFSPDERGQVKTSAVQDALAARGMTVAEMPAAFLSALRRGSSGMLGFQDFKSLFEADESFCVMSSMVMGMRSTGTDEL